MAVFILLDRISLPRPELSEPATSHTWLAIPPPLKRIAPARPTRRPAKRKRPEQAAGPPLAGAPTEATPAPAADGAGQPDYGRWTVNGGSGSGARAGPAIRTLLCDVSNLASLPEAKRRACLDRVRVAAAKPVHDARARDWTDRTALPCSIGRKRSQRGVALDLCDGPRLRLRF